MEHVKSQAVALVTVENICRPGNTHAESAQGAIDVAGVGNGSGDARREFGAFESEWTVLIGELAALSERAVEHALVATREQAMLMSKENRHRQSLDELGRKYEGLVARERRYKKQLEENEADRRCILKRLEELEHKYRGMMGREERHRDAFEMLERKYRGMIGREERYRKEIDKQKARVARLKQSWRWRIGTAILLPILLPAWGFKRLARLVMRPPESRDRAPDRQGPLSLGDEPFSKLEYVLETQGVEAAVQHVRDVCEVGRRLEMWRWLYARVATENYQGVVTCLEGICEIEPNRQDLHRLASLGYYKLGSLERPFTALSRIEPEQEEADKKLALLSEMVRGARRLLREGIELPSRQPNPNGFVWPKRVMYCLHSSVPYNTNGYSTRSHGVVVGTRDVGWDVRPVTRPGYPWDSRVSIDKLPADYRLENETEGIRYVALAGPNLNETGLDRYIVEAADVFHREAQRLCPEIIHSASNHITALSALIAARRLGVPFVYEVRGLWEITQASETPGWEQSERYRLAVKLETLVAREADRVLALTQELKVELVRRGVAPDRITVAPNCVDTDVFAPMPRDEKLARELGLATGVPTIGFAGSVVDYEGLDLLVEALVLVRERGVPFNLLVVGDGRVLDGVKARTKQLGIEDVCRFPGRVPFEAVTRYISCMDIMPCPRKPNEVTEMVSPLKPLESMAMSKAVLLSDVSPHRTLVEDGVRGLLFRKGDVADLADKLTTLLRDAELRQRLGRAARQWVTLNRTWTHVGHVIEEAYLEVRQGAERRRAELAAKTGAARSLRDMRIAIIADRFTTDALAPETNLLRITPDDWREVFAHERVDALIVESAWEGNGGAWHRKVGRYEDDEFQPITELLAHCRAHGVPSLFWNKEDPVHYHRFKATAALCDHVFTTDASIIGRYLGHPNTQAKSVSGLPFFAQPKLHNPLPAARAWSHTACYGGTYYGDRYPDRKKVLDALLGAASQRGLVIYDRQHFNSESPYKFPPTLARFVQGGLDYADMVQAYKAHPVHINGNSVVKSPTMFSRRVVEATACGALVISGPGEGVAQVMDGLVPIVSSKDATAKLLDRHLHDEMARHVAVLPAMRHVFRHHTSGHRLAQMLRTAGLVVWAPAPAAYGVITPRLDAGLAERLAAQTVPPGLVVAAEVTPEAARVLQQRGCAVHVVETLGEARIAIEEARIEWIVPLAAGSGDAAHAPNWFEDMLLAGAYADADAIGRRRVVIRKDEEVRGGLPYVSRTERPDPNAVLLRAVSPGFDLPAALPIAEAVVSAQARIPTSSVLVLLDYIREDDRGVSDGPNGLKTETKVGRTITPKTVLVAGHDLKFCRDIIQHFEASGLTVLVDQWQGHSQHDEKRSLELLGKAEVVFCEWCLGNAVWYAERKRPEQRLIGRLHAQEIRSSLLAKVDFSAFEKIIFVGPHIRDIVVRDYGLHPDQAVVIPNTVDVDALDRPKVGDYRHALGLVGIVPKMKRLDRALDILEHLLEKDSAFHLYVKGKRPEDYPWMLKRPEEMAYYEVQHRRLEMNPALKAAISFDGYGDDMSEWYRKIGFVLSVSDFESFHLTIADGGAARAVPVVLPWEGADRIYPPDWISLDVGTCAEKIIHLTSDTTQLMAVQERARHYVVSQFARRKVVGDIVRLVVGG